MAERLTAEGATSGKKKEKKKTNGFDAEKVKQFADEIHELLDEMETAAGEYKSKIKVKYDEAVELAGATRKLLHEAIADERTRRKKAKRIAKMDKDEKAELEKLIATLGGTPLAAWAAGSSSVQ